MVDSRGNPLNESFEVTLDGKRIKNPVTGDCRFTGEIENPKASFGKYGIKPIIRSGGNVVYKNVSIQLTNGTDTISREGGQVTFRIIFDIADGKFQYQVGDQSITQLPERNSDAIYRFILTYPKGGASCTMPNEFTVHLTMNGMNTQKADVVGFEMRNAGGWTRYLFDIIAQGLLTSNNQKVSLKSIGLQKANSAALDRVQDGVYLIIFSFVKLGVLNPGDTEVFTI